MIKQLCFGVVLSTSLMNFSFAFSDRPPFPGCVQENSDRPCMLKPNPVPEIDASATPLALGILVIGLLVVVERSRKPKK